MKRVSLDKEIRSKSIIGASKVFAKYLALKGYDWASEEVIETVENGYRCCSNASRHNLVMGLSTFPASDDWSYYWAFEPLESGGWYCWFIERS